MSELKRSLRVKMGLETIEEIVQLAKVSKEYPTHTTGPEKRLADGVLKLKAQNKILLAALETYADEDNWSDNYSNEMFMYEIIHGYTLAQTAIDSVKGK